MTYRRINLFGAPSSGKSTTASWLFSSLKAMNLQVELVQEYVKQWTYIPREIEGFDQVFLFANQLHLEDICLRNNDKQLIVSDSPLLSNAWYGIHDKRPGFVGLMHIVAEFEKKFPSINIVLDRPSHFIYDEHARFHTKDESDKIHEYLVNFLNVSYKIGKIHHLQSIRSDSYSELFDLVVDLLNIEKSSKSSKSEMTCDVFGLDSKDDYKIYEDFKVDKKT